MQSVSVVGLASICDHEFHPCTTAAARYTRLNSRWLIKITITVSSESVESGVSAVGASVESPVVTPHFWLTRLGKLGHCCTEYC